MIELIFPKSLLLKINKECMNILNDSLTFSQIYYFTKFKEEIFHLFLIQIKESVDISYTLKFEKIEWLFYNNLLVINENVS